MELLLDRRKGVNEGFAVSYRVLRIMTASISRGRECVGLLVFPSLYTLAVSRARFRFSWCGLGRLSVQNIIEACKEQRIVNVLIPSLPPRFGFKWLDGSETLLLA